MRRSISYPYRTFLRTGLPAILLALVFQFLPAPVWAVCEVGPFRKYMDKTYSGVDTIVLAKAGPVLEKRPAMLIADGFQASYHYDGETVTYEFSVVRFLMGGSSNKIGVEQTYWETINNQPIDPKTESATVFSEGEVYLLLLRPMGTNNFEVGGCSPLENLAEARWKMLFFDTYFQKLDNQGVIRGLWKELSKVIPEVKPGEGKDHSKKLPQHRALQKILQTTGRELEHISYHSIKIMTEIVGLLGEKDEKSEKILFEYFKEEKNKLSTYSKSEMKRHRNWTLLLASSLAWFHKDLINEVLIPYLAEELKGPNSYKAELVLSNIGTDKAIAEIRNHYHGK